MAYQNVGTPRFYVNGLAYLKAIGLGGTVHEASTWAPGSSALYELSGDINMLDPTNPIVFDMPIPAYGFYIKYKFGLDLSYILNKNSANNFGAFLGHTARFTLGESLSNMTLQIPNNANTYTTNIINSELFQLSASSTGEEILPSYNGFSIFKFVYNDAEGWSGETEDPDVLTLLGHAEGPGQDLPVGELCAGSVAMGRIYTMPYSPELKLTMTREMDGVNSIRTKGGNALVNKKYTKPPKWYPGYVAPWELHVQGLSLSEGYAHGLARVGRRTWDLSFNHLEGGEIFPEMITTAQSDTVYQMYTDIDGSLPPAGGSNAAMDELTLLTSDTFFSQVIHKTLGGQLPFIFQPDSLNSNQDQFAICKMDMKSFKLKQVANGVYNIKLKIREVW